MARSFRRKGDRYVAKFDEMERGVVAGLMEQTREIVAPPDVGDRPETGDAFDDLVAGGECGHSVEEPAGEQPGDRRDTDLRSVHLDEQQVAPRPRHVRALPACCRPDAATDCRA